ncbi:MAG: hypothetical protein J6Z23_07140 [Lachnospiraceae bacterium]|nr:hypothetical protein [Lachnospiraceae bacterium]
MKEKEKKGKIGTLASRVRTGAGIVKGVSKAADITKTYVVPVLLLTFAVVAYAVYGVAIPKN